MLFSGDFRFEYNINKNILSFSSKNMVKIKQIAGILSQGISMFVLKYISHS